MSETAFKIRYRDEFIASFEQHQSLLRNTVTTETMRDGHQATFLVAGSGGAEAVSRGVNGLIPARADDLNQYTATLVEWHDLVRRNRFNIFASQGNAQAIMQKSTMAVVNRKIDSDIITELNTATVNTGTATVGSLLMAIRAKTILGVAEVPFDNNITGLITPAMEGYFLQVKEFASAEYVNGKPIPAADTAWNDQARMFKWLGINWIVHPKLPGVGTAAEKCFMYHKNAIGHAVSTGDIQTAVGYDEEQDYSYCRATIFMGSKLLQSSGVVVMNHDGSALAAA